MIGIRTVTFNLKETMSKEDYSRVAKAKLAFARFRYPARTFRLNLYPVSSTDCKSIEKADAFCEKEGITWFSVPIRNSNSRNKFILGNEFEDAIYGLLESYPRAFVNLAGVENGEMDLVIPDMYVKIMKRLSKLNPDGSGAFRFGLSVNAKKDGPFFPFTESSGNLSFSLGLELTEKINRIAKSNRSLSLEELRDRIVLELDGQIAEIENYAVMIEELTGIIFRGFDFSLAPTLNSDGSILQLLNRLGLKGFGGGGFFFGTAYLTNILKSFGNRHRHVGFSGVMYSPLEDKGLCAVHNKTGIRLEDLIKVSTMCGCGIDMVPVHQSANTEILKSYIYDIYAISCRLDNKPLGVRFLAFDDSLVYTAFKEDDFLTNGKILELNGNIVDDHDVSSFCFWEIV